MSAKVFIDTNIFVYAKLLNAQDQGKYQQAKRFLQAQQSVVISSQVLNEFANVLFKHRVADANIQLAIDAIAENSLVAPVSFYTVQEALKIKSRWQFSYWDSLIIASALENGCSTLFTEDLQHNQVIDGKLLLKNPFL